MVSPEPEYSFLTALFPWSLYTFSNENQLQVYTRTNRNLPQYYKLRSLESENFYLFDYRTYSDDIGKALDIDFTKKGCAQP